jgi:hypothetical protein
MKKLHMGTMSFGSDTMDEVVHQLNTAFGGDGARLGTTHGKQGSLSTGIQLANRGRRDMSARIRDVVLSLALCHNVRFRLFSTAMTDITFLRSLPLPTTMGPSPTKPRHRMKSPSSIGPRQLA